MADTANIAANMTPEEKKSFATKEMHMPSELYDTFLQVRPEYLDKLINSKSDVDQIHEASFALKQKVKEHVDFIIDRLGDVAEREDMTKGEAEVLISAAIAGFGTDIKKAGEVTIMFARMMVSASGVADELAAGLTNGFEEEHPVRNVSLSPIQ